MLNPWGEGDERVVRGGGWNQTDCRSASRAKPMWEGQYPWGDFVGFRPVRQKKGAAKPPKRALTEEEQSKARFNMALAQRYRRMREKLGLPPTEGMWGDDSGGEAGP